MKTIYKIFEEMNLQNSETHKVNTLKRYKQYPLLEDVITYAYNPQYRFYFKQIPEYKSNTSLSPNDEVEFKEIFSTLDDLMNGNITGNIAVQQVKLVLESISSENAYIFERMIAKNLEIGVGIKTINKAYGRKVIPEIPYWRCSTIKEIHRISYPAIVQTKADGAFINIIIEDGQPRFLTRTGNPVELPYVSQDIINNLVSNDIDNCVIFGEILVDGMVDKFNRSKGNGRVNSLLSKDSTYETFKSKIEKAKTEYSKNKLKQELEDKFIEWEDTNKNAFIKVWDIVLLDEFNESKSNISYSVRWNTLNNVINTHKPNKLKLIHSEVVDNEEEALKFYEQEKEKGEEGAVLKDFKTLWKNGTSTTQIKLKPKYDLELEIVGWEYGDSDKEFRNGIGRFICKTCDGEFTAITGSGLTREQRGLQPINSKNLSEGLEVIPGFNFDQYIGQIAQLEHYGPTVSKDGKVSLQFLVFKGIRHDKVEADSYQSILDLLD